MKKDLKDQVKMDNEVISYYMAKSSFKRSVTAQDYWEVSNQEINRRSPIFKGDAKVIHAPANSGKSWLLKSMVKDIKATHPDVYIVVVLIDEREVERADWQECGIDELIFLPNTFRAIKSELWMWERFLDTMAKCLAMETEEKKDVLLVIDSLNKLASIASSAKIVEEGKTLPGGVDENAINLVGSYVGTSGNPVDGGSLTIWGTCLLQDERDALCKGSSAILNGISRSDVVLNRDHSLNEKSHSRSSYLINKSDVESKKVDINKIFKNGIPSCWKRSSRSAC